jgi:hypothetical protein
VSLTTTDADVDVVQEFGDEELGITNYVTRSRLQACSSAKTETDQRLEQILRRDEGQLL